MSVSKLTGLFGKLPAHGDFIQRNLPASFVNVWDQWLQGFVGGSQEQLGEEWLDTYLTSPIWRFVLSEGVVDEHQWAGVALPSVDRVGRYYPFSAITRIDFKTNPCEFAATQMAWFDALEQICLSALDGKILIDELVEEINAANPINEGSYDKVSPADTNGGVIVEMEFEEQSPSTVYPYLLDSFASQALSSYSVWSTKGSELINPCTFITQGLPAIAGVAAMLDGRWSHWQWQQPQLLKLNNLL